MQENTGDRGDAHPGVRAWSSARVRLAPHSLCRAAGAPVKPCPRRVGTSPQRLPRAGESFHQELRLPAGRRGVSGPERPLSEEPPSSPTRFSQQMTQKRSKTGGKKKPRPSGPPSLPCRCGGQQGGVPGCCGRCSTLLAAASLPCRCGGQRTLQYPARCCGVLGRERGAPPAAL